MNRYLKSYQVVMRTDGPVFIGSGRDIGKKEYIWMQNRVGIPDMNGLFREMVRRKKQAAFEDYLLGYSNLELTDWLRRENIRVNELQPFLRYTLDYGSLTEGKREEYQVKECIKDAYGKPYIPGSTLKGMFRTILLGADILEHPEKYRNVKDKLRLNSDRDMNRSLYLQKDTKEIEGIFYRVLTRDKEKPDNAVNDILQGLVVSDSEPLPVDRLALCQKIDVHRNGNEKRIPILRECIKPGTEIRFLITVDTSVCDVTAESLLAAVKAFMTCYYNKFSVMFKEWIKVPNVKQVFCGGGCGFVSKTIIYPMYGKKDGIEVAQKIFEKTKVPVSHKHNKDKEFGVSPHVIKCTRYQGQLYQMGLCTIQKIEPM